MRALAPEGQKFVSRDLRLVSSMQAAVSNARISLTISSKSRVENQESPPGSPSRSPSLRTLRNPFGIRYNAYEHATATMQDDRRIVPAKTWRQHLATSACPKLEEGRD